MDLNTDINEINLSQRTKSTLIRLGGIKTLNDLVNYDLNKLKELRNIGTKSFEEIQSFLSTLEIRNEK